ncbi:MAG: 2-oxoglutarate dehydrogenase complex dihydrolipoyllysine-residue succinyltransferase [Magnetovibrionaceae bacterium]
MATDILVPTLGESVTEATVAKWLKGVGEAVAADEPLLELETDKVTLEVNAPTAGVLAEIVAEEGTDVELGALLGKITEGEGAPAPAPAAKEEPKAEAAPAPKEEAKPAPAPAAPAPAAATSAAAPTTMPLSPAVAKLVNDNSLDAGQIPATGKGGRLTKGDVLAFLKSGAKAKPAAAPAAPAGGIVPASELPPRPEDPREEKVRMTKLRKMIAGRLKQAQNTAAMLTTYNEVDMTNAMQLRADLKDIFEKRHGVRVGFMSIFVKAAVEALKDWPAVNAEIYGDEIVYKNFYDISIAVGSPQGLVVPVLRDADKKTFAEVEKGIGDFGRRARDGKLTMDEMQGGTFTISNGGVYGSLMSSPILNPPQSGILGMHKIQPRPMVMPDGSIEARPMMYLALSYDHRIVDGREAVSFLVRIKECVEDPRRMLLEA